MNKKIIYLLILMFVYSIGNRGAANPASAWKEEMQALKNSLVGVLPYAAKSESFNAPENALKIQGYLNEISSRTQYMQHGDIEQKDPTVEFVAKAFENNLKAVQDFNLKGRRDVGRLLVLNSTAYCIECHTRTKSSVRFLDKNPLSSFGPLNPVEKVEYLISVREFQSAFDTILQKLSKDSELPLFGAEDLIRYGLTLTVKNFDDPKAALKMVDRALVSEQVPFVVRSDLSQWKISLLEWQKEKKIRKKLIFSERILAAEGLIRKAQQLNLKAQSVHAGDVEIHRANALLLGLYDEDIPKESQSRVLFLIGETYRLLPEHLFWPLHGSYYEACIRRDPGSTQAQICYRTFEDSIVLSGFIDSSPEQTPSEMIRKMKELKGLAYPKSPKDGLASPTE